MDSSMVGTAGPRGGVLAVGLASDDGWWQPYTANCCRCTPMLRGMGFGGAAPPSSDVGISPRMGTRLDAVGLPSW